MKETKASERKRIVRLMHVADVDQLDLDGQTRIDCGRQIG
jgi:hypothetical protein